MKLLYTTRSPYARKARIIALEKKIELELVTTDLLNKSDEFMKINPLGKIPALVLDDDSTLVDSAVICQYLDEMSAPPRFIPTEGEDKFEILTLARVADGLMDITVDIFAEKLRHKDNPNEGFIEGRKKSIRATLELLEENLEMLTGLDIASLNAACALGYIEFRTPELLPGEDSPLMEWYREMLKRPSFAETMPE